MLIKSISIIPTFSRQIILNSLMNRIQSDINLWRHNPEQLWTLGGLFCPLQCTNCNYMHWKQLKLEIWQSSSNCILMSTQDTDTASLTWVTWNGVDKMGYNLQFIVKSMITYRHCSCTEDYMCSRHIHARPCVQKNTSGHHHRNISNIF